MPEQGYSLEDAKDVFKLVCEAKLKSTQDYINYLLDGLQSKMLLFAHHRIMLDAVEQTLRSRKVLSTARFTLSSLKRQSLCSPRIEHLRQQKGNGRSVRHCRLHGRRSALRCEQRWLRKGQLSPRGRKRPIRRSVRRCVLHGRRNALRCEHRLLRIEQLRRPVSICWRESDEPSSW